MNRSIGKYVLYVFKSTELSLSGVSNLFLHKVEFEFAWESRAKIT